MCDIKKSRALKGSYTVEAALLLPLILFVIVLLMYAAFFLYDDCCIRQSSYLAALRAERGYRTAAEQKQQAELMLKRYLEEELWAAQGTRYEAAADGDAVRTTVKCRLKAPLGNRIFQTVWELEADGEARHIRPVTFIRTCNRAKDALSLLKNGGMQ